MCVVKTSKVPLLKTENVLIVPFGNDLNDLQTKDLEESLLERAARSDINGVVLDVSSMETIDLFTAQKLVKLVNMVALMDVSAVMVGMKPSVAITLTEMNAKFPGIATALTLEKGLETVKRLRQK